MYYNSYNIIKLVLQFKQQIVLFSAKAIKHEPIEEEDDDEEEDEEHLKAGEVTDEGDTEEGDNGETRNVVVKKRSERLRSGDKERNEEQDVDEDQVESVANDGGFEDMYSRVKRKRTRRSIYDGEMLNRRRQRERKCVQRQGKGLCVAYNLKYNIKLE